MSTILDKNGGSSGGDGGCGGKSFPQGGDGGSGSSVDDKMKVIYYHEIKEDLKHFCSVVLNKKLDVPKSVKKLADELNQKWNGK